MPVMVCKINNKPGFKYGASGRCYSYSAGSESGRAAAKKKAILQGAAIAQNTGEKLIVKATAEKVDSWEEAQWTKQAAIDWLTKYGLSAHNYVFTGYSHRFIQGTTELDEYSSGESKRWVYQDDGINFTIIGDIEEPIILEVRFNAKEKEKLTFTMEKEKTTYDDENNLIFGWGYVAIEKDGKQIMDHSGEFVDEETLKDLEIATYGFNIGSRKSGFGHKGLAKGYLAESMFFTKEKLKVLGLPEDALPQGEWLGVWFPDDEDYAKIKKMKSPMFSMEGSAIKEEV